MEFKSQICTTIEQSKRLLELGLNPETADMFHVFDYTIWHINGIQELVHPNQLEETDVPAWSLHRLMEIGNFVNVAFLDVNKAYKVCIDNIEEQIRFGIINKEYLNEK